MTSRRRGSRGGGPAPEPGDAAADLVLRVNGWTLLFHPLLLDQLERLVAAAERERATRAPGASAGPNTKLAAAIRRLVLHEVPEDPSRPRYRHGGTLGGDLKHWLRAKFGNGRFRLFFRYRQDVRLLVFAWVNDAESLRTYGSRTDAYAVFHRMLDAGSPADDREALVRAAASPDTLRRARGLVDPADPAPPA